MVYSQRGNLIDQFLNLLDLDECPLWLEPELTVAMNDPTFACRQTIERKNANSSSNTPAPAPSPAPAPLPAPAPSPAPAPAPSEQPVPQYTGIHALTNLAKLYNDDMKFTGDLHDVLNIKLNIFYDLYTKAGVNESNYATAFGTMLKGKVQSFYYQHLTQKNLPFDAIVDRMRIYFHTPENHQLFLNEWRTTMLKDVIATNPDKNLAECLEIIIERLQRTY